MRSSQKDIALVANLIQNDLSKELGVDCRLYQESGMCKVVRVNALGVRQNSLTAVYDARTLYKVVLDIIDIKRGFVLL